MMKLKYRCDRCDDGMPCILSLRVDNEPDHPFRCPWSYETDCEVAEWVRIDKNAPPVYDIVCGDTVIIPGYASAAAAEDIIADLCMKNVTVQQRDTT